MYKVTFEQKGNIEIDFVEADNYKYSCGFFTFYLLTKPVASYRANCVRNIFQEEQEDDEIILGVGTRLSGKASGISTLIVGIVYGVDFSKEDMPVEVLYEVSYEDMITKHRFTTEQLANCFYVVVD